MQYSTSHLTALAPMRYEGRVMDVGDTFQATEIDAGYLLRSGACRLAEATPLVAVPQAEERKLMQAESAPPPKRRGRPPKSSYAALPPPPAESLVMTAASPIAVTAAPSPQAEASETTTVQPLRAADLQVPVERHEPAAEQ